MFDEVEQREAALKAKEEALKAQVSSAEKSKVTSAEDTKKLEIKLKGAEKKNKWLWKTINKLKEEKSNLKNQLKEEKSKLQTIEVSPVKPTGEGDGDEVSIEEYNEVLKKLKLVDMRKSELNENLKEISLKFENSSQTVQNLTDEILGLKLELEESQQKNEESERKVNELENEIEVYETRLADKDKEIKEVEEKMRKMKIEHTKKLLAPRESVLARRKSVHVQEEEKELAAFLGEQEEIEGRGGRAQTLYVPGSSLIGEPADMGEGKKAGERMAGKTEMTEQETNMRQSHFNMRASTRNSVGYVDSKSPTHSTHSQIFPYNFSL